MSYLDAAGSYAGKLVGAVNPITSRPSAPLESLAILDSLQPSLMPRSSLHQGVVTGLSILAAKAASGGLQRVVTMIAPASGGLGARLGVEAAIAGVGALGTRLPNDPDAPLPVAIARSVSGWTVAAAVGGVLYDGGRLIEQRHGGSFRLRHLLFGGAATTALLLASRRMLQQRQQLLVPGPQPPAQKAIVVGATAAASVLVGRGLHLGNRASGQAINQWFGPGPSKRLASGLVNAALWGGGAAALYWAGIAKIGKSNEKLDHGYDAAPTHPTTSGGPNSEVAFDEIGREGRRYVTDLVTPELIESVMAEPAQQTPVRAFVGFNTDPLSFQRRAEMALDELERLGGFDRSTLLLVSATGTGWVDDAMIAAAELAARGDIASVCVQYGRYPSFLSVQKVAQGRRQFRLLLYGVRQRLRAMPPEQRPRVVIFGESLGAWTSSDSLLAGGELRFEHYGVERALWFGMPDMAAMGRKGKDGPANAVQTGVALVDNAEQLDVLSATEQEQVRAVILSHDNDPIAKLGTELIFRRPRWLGKERGRGVPSHLQWTPLVTFLQTAIDAANAMNLVPGQFFSTGHDYRGDTAWFVSHGLSFDVTPEQLARMETALRELELERHQRLEGGKDAAPKKTKGAQWFSRWLPHHGNGSTAKAASEQPAQ